MYILMNNLSPAGPSLRVVSTMSVGYGTYDQFTHTFMRLTQPSEHFDTTELTRRNIRMGYTPGVLTNAGMNISTSTFH